jgi:hypothetical protein
MRLTCLLDALECQAVRPRVQSAGRWQPRFERRVVFLELNGSCGFGQFQSDWRGPALAADKPQDQLPDRKLCCLGP